MPRPSNVTDARGRHWVRGTAETVDCDRSYNVAKLGFEWSSIIERKGHRRQPLLIAVGPKQDTSQFVTGDSESAQDLVEAR